MMEPRKRASDLLLYLVVGIRRARSGLSGGMQAAAAALGRRQIGIIEHEATAANSVFLVFGIFLPGGRG